MRVGCVAPEHHYSEDDQAPDVKLRKNTAKKERVTYTPGPPGYVSIVVIKRADADDPGGRGCCVQSAADDKLLPSKPSSVVDFAEEASPADPVAEA